MNKIIKLVREYQINKEDTLFEEIIKAYQSLINKYCKKVLKKDVEDFYQEILMKIYKVIMNFKINHEVDNQYLPNFLKKYQLKVIDKIEYELFCNENQLTKYVEKTIKNTYIDYIRKMSKNDVILDEQLIETTLDRSIANNILFQYDFTTEERAFLELFLDQDKWLTESEVGRKLGVSRQAINKRKKKIITKYQKLRR